LGFGRRLWLTRKMRTRDLLEGVLQEDWEQEQAREFGLDDNDDSDDEM
jgi:hypothetical protein